MDLPLGQTDLFFQRLSTHIYSPVMAGTMSAEFFGEEGYGRINGGTRVLELAADSWEAALARGSLAIDSHVSFMSPLGVRLEATQDGGGSQPEERHGLAAEVMRIIRRRKKMVRGAFWKNIPVPNIFCGAATRSRCPTYHFPSRYPVIDRLPQALCLGLS
jgi:hypothetical protein